MTQTMNITVIVFGSRPIETRLMVMRYYRWVFVCLYTSSRLWAGTGAPLGLLPRPRTFAPRGASKPLKKSNKSAIFAPQPPQTIVHYGRFPCSLPRKPPALGWNRSSVGSPAPPARLCAARGLKTGKNCLNRRFSPLNPRSLGLQ